MLIFLMLVGTYTVFSLWGIRDKSRALEARDFSGLELSTKMKETILKIDRFFAEYFAFDNPAAINKLKIQEDKFRTLILEFKELARNEPGVIDQLEHLEGDFATYLKVFQELKDNPSLVQERQKLFFKLNEAAEEMRKEIDLFQDEDVVRLSVSLGRIYIAASRAKSANILFMLISLILSGLISFRVASSINKPLQKLTQGTKAVAKGDFDYRVQTFSRDEISDVADSFNWMAGNLQHIYRTQNLMHSLLKVSLETLSLSKFLEEALTVIISSGSLPLLPMGMVFTVEDNPGVLVMKAQKGISAPIIARCSEVPFGTCACGQAAREQKINCCVSSDDACHAVCYEGMMRHSLCCIPILSSGIVLGVLNLYLKEGCQAEDKERNEIMSGIANTLAGVIVRKRAEDELKVAYDQLKATQAQLVQSAKMASVGLLAGGVAHEINNPLTGVLNNVQLIRMMAEVKKDFVMSDFKELLAVIEESALRCKRITQSLLDFSHASKGAFQPISLNEIIEKVSTLIENELGLQNIAIQKQLQPNLPHILGDSQLLQQVVFDIISNAKWAIQEKPEKESGLITLKTQYEPEKKQVLISISDTGIGITKENLEKLSEPFFTTKQVGEGTGLGLSIVYKIIKAHQGTIEVESQVGKGTTFKIGLPTA